jgi:hypothetical protein
VRKQMARVFAEKVEQGQYTVDDALSIARSILFESPQTLLNMRPRTDSVDYPKSEVGASSRPAKSQSDSP